jgi:hypothetical protein
MNRKFVIILLTFLWNSSWTSRTLPPPLVFKIIEAKYAAKTF